MEIWYDKSSKPTKEELKGEFWYFFIIAICCLFLLLVFGVISMDYPRFLGLTMIAGFLWLFFSQYIFRVKDVYWAWFGEKRK
ncbi:MAG: hypothetical protein H7836_10805 [Magnetococcus sp. YQC-3]